MAAEEVAVVHTTIPQSSTRSRSVMTKNKDRLFSGKAPSTLSKEVLRKDKLTSVITNSEPILHKTVNDEESFKQTSNDLHETVPNGIDFTTFISTNIADNHGLRLNDHLQMCVDSFISSSSNCSSEVERVLTEVEVSDAHCSELTKDDFEERHKEYSLTLEASEIVDEIVRDETQNDGLNTPLMPVPHNITEGSDIVNALKELLRIDDSTSNLGSSTLDQIDLASLFNSTTIDLINGVPMSETMINKENEKMDLILDYAKQEFLESTINKHGAIVDQSLESLESVLKLSEILNKDVIEKNESCPKSSEYVDHSTIDSQIGDISRCNQSIDNLESESNVLIRSESTIFIDNEDSLPIKEETTIFIDNEDSLPMKKESTIFIDNEDSLSMKEGTLPIKVEDENEYGPFNVRDERTELNEPKSTDCKRTEPEEKTEYIPKPDQFSSERAAEPTTRLPIALSLIRFIFYQLNFLRRLIAAIPWITLFKVLVLLHMTSASNAVVCLCLLGVLVYYLMPNFGPGRWLRHVFALPTEPCLEDLSDTLRMQMLSKVGPFSDDYRPLASRWILAIYQWIFIFFFSFVPSWKPAEVMLELEPDN